MRVELVGDVRGAHAAVSSGTSSMVWVGRVLSVCRTSEMEPALK